MMKLYKFRRQKTLVKIQVPQMEKEGRSNNIFFDDRKTDMEVNFICRVLSGEQELYWGVNSINDCSESI